MHLDVRLPMGYLFALLGVILSVYGLVSDKAMYARHSLGQNVNLIWGCVFFLLGVVMLWLAKRARSS